MQNAGIDDGEILEVNQVTAYFCYANRTVLGLGTTTEGDELGLSPGNNDNPDDLEMINNTRRPGTGVSMGH